MMSATAVFFTFLTSCTFKITFFSRGIFVEGGVFAYNVAVSLDFFSVKFASVCQNKIPPALCFFIYFMHKQEEICLFGIIFFKIFEFSAFPKSVNAGSLHGTENAVFYALVFLVKLPQKLLYVFSVALLVGRAGGMENGKIGMVDEIFYVLFRCVNQRTKKGYVGSVKIGYGGETAKPTLEE